MIQIPLDFQQIKIHKMAMDIALVTLNSTYQHTAFGLRYLLANLGELKPRAQIFEFITKKNPMEIVEEILKQRPRIVGFGVYIWNTKPTLKVIELLKQQSPETLVVLGGPEVSHESEAQLICQQADYVIRGEADLLFRDFCESLLLRNHKPEKKFISGALPEITTLQSPYGYFTDDDIKNRIVYVEASRGCPYKCEYCLSSLDKSVRHFPTDLFLQDLEILIQRGARQFKFIDRTFNLSPSISGKILQFFLSHIEKGLFLHFEMVPDRLPLELRDLIQRFPPGCLQFEIGIQTLNPHVATLVSRKNDMHKVRENFAFLAEHTGVHTHADLIAGLPGESLESFAKGFDQLLLMKPNEIQIGILKRLKGTPIVRHDSLWEMSYSAEPPFQIVSTKTMDHLSIEKMQRLSRYWDMIANSGQFKSTFSLIQTQLEKQQTSVFFWFWQLTDFLTLRFQKTHSVHLLPLFEALLEYLRQNGFDTESVIPCLAQDYRNGGRQDVPSFLKQDHKPSPQTESSSSLALPRRQRRHQNNYVSI